MHAKGTADAASDLDFYLFSESVVSNDDRTGLTIQFSPEIRQVISWCRTPFNSVGTDFYLGNLKIECWLRNTISIDHALRECVEGIVKRDWVTWTTAGFYNHCVLSDLNNMIPVDDPSGTPARSERKHPHLSPKLRKAIIEQHLGAARFWPWNFHYESAIERQDAIYCTGIVQQVVHNLIQVIFAANGVYFPGDKKLFDAMRHLDRTPNLWLPRVQKLLFPAVPVSKEALLGQQQELQELVDDVRRFRQ